MEHVRHAWPLSNLWGRRAASRHGTTAHQAGLGHGILISEGRLAKAEIRALQGVPRLRCMSPGLKLAHPRTVHVGWTPEQCQCLSVCTAHLPKIAFSQNNRKLPSRCG